MDRWIFRVLTLVVALAVPVMVFAGTTGKIAGYVKDAKTGEPLPAVNIIIEGTTMGASTDANGYYVILNVPVGTYTLRASMIGYKEVRLENVKVSVDLTSYHDFSLEPTVIAGETVTITAVRPLVEKDVTMSRTVFEKDNVENLPQITHVNDAVRLTAGYVRGSFRGGRIDTGEELYLVDGVQLRNPIGRKNWGQISGEGSIALATRLSPLAIEQMEVIRGGFNAEYGNVQSAVVNIVTKEGGKRHTGEIRFFFDPPAVFGKTGEFRLTAPRKYYRFVESDPFYRNMVQGWFRNRYLQWSLGGPEPITTYLLKDIIPGELTYHISGDYQHLTLARFTPDRTIPADKFDPNNNAHFVTSKPDQFAYSVNAKLTYRPSAKFKITLMGLKSRRVDLPYYGLVVSSGDEILSVGFNEQTGDIDTAIVTVDKMLLMGWDPNMPEDERARYEVPVKAYDKSRNFWHNYFWQNHLALSITHTLSAKTFYNLVFNYFETNMDRLTRDPATGKVLEYYDDQPWGFDALRFRQNYLRLVHNVAYASVNHITRGIHRPRQKYFEIKGDITSQVTDKHQIKAGFDVFLYDLKQWRYTVASGGNDYNDDYHRKPWDLGVYVQDKMETAGMVLNIGYRMDVRSPEAEYPKDYLDPVVDPSRSPSQIKNPVRTKPDIVFSPRLGISYPITDVDMMHFSYGHFYQYAPYDRYFANTHYDLRGAFNYIGNPNLKPEKTVSYEFGVEHAFTNDLGLDITAFYKDVTDLIDVQEIIDANGIHYYYYKNFDYSNIRGFEFTLTKRYSHNFSGQITYTLQWAYSRTNHVYQSFIDLYDTVAPRAKFFRSNFDQRHTINVNFDYRVPEGWGPTVFGMKPFGDWGLNVLFRAGSGNPFSSPRRTFYPPINDDEYPWWWQTDIRFNKDIKITNWAKLSFFVNVLNLFNDTRIWSVANIEWYQMTRDGIAYAYRGPRAEGYQPERITEADPEGYLWPQPDRKGYARRIQFGISLKIL